MKHFIFYVSKTIFGELRGEKMFIILRMKDKPLMTGRDAMVNPEKMKQLKNLLKKTREELSKILKDDEKNPNKE